MKTSPSYPTRHPHWIDVDPETELEKNKMKARFIKVGLSFKWAFLIVLGFHVILLCGIYATSSLKPKVPHPTAAVETPKTTAQGPKSDALARNEWPQPDATPEVKALPPAPKKVAAAPKPVPVAPKPAERVSSKSIPSNAVAVAAPKTTPTAPPAPKPSEATLKETLLAAKNTAPHTKADAEVQERIPVSTSPQPIVAEIIPSPTPAKAVAATPPPAPVSEYTLSSGDNLYAVSRRLQVTYSELMEANGITDPRQLRIGQKLKVPSRANDSTCAL
ncbi:MAG: LysM peptidoglycan-binding domain-containing protein [Spartobacteria bacterium]